MSKEPDVNAASLGNSSNAIAADGDKEELKSTSTSTDTSGSSSSSTTYSTESSPCPQSSSTEAPPQKRPKIHDSSLQSNSKQCSSSQTHITDENENDPLLSAAQVLKSLDEDISIEEQAIAVLGGADDSKCTYNQGYLPRQALYACLTCKENSKHPLLCYACSIHCHDEHTVIELFTKRSTRCDCPTHSCKIQPLVVDPNYKNRYNQNSQLGKYCICKTTFPDETDPIADSMYQCVVCEDWFHSRHLFTEDEITLEVENNAIEEHITHQVVFKNKSLENLLDAATSEVVCVACRKKHPYLANVAHLCKNVPDPKPAGITKALIFDNSRRVQWQQCEDCDDLLDRHKIEFLADLQDSIYHFEKVQNQAVDSQMEAYMNQNFDHAGKLKLISGITDLKEGLKEFLEKRKSDGGDTVITEENVREFFDEFSNRSKLK